MSSVVPTDYCVDEQADALAHVHLLGTILTDDGGERIFCHWKSAALAGILLVSRDSSCVYRVMMFGW